MKVVRNGLAGDTDTDRAWRERSTRKAADSAREKARNRAREPRRATKPVRRSTKPANDWPRESKAIMRVRSGGRCELDDCTRPAAEFHHRLARRHGNHRPSNGLYLCWYCHRVGVHGIARRLAEAKGWIVRSTSGDPQEVPVFRRGEMVALDDDGSVSRIAV